MERLRFLIADDEAAARSLLRRYAAAADIDVVRECATTSSVAQALSECAVDAALLDIRMPGPDIFSVLAECAKRQPLPALIFATAHDGYAVRAFEVNAIDYLVKPILEGRFRDAIVRLRERTIGRDSGGSVPQLLNDLGPRPDRLLVPVGRRIVPLNLSEIDWVRAEGNYARIHAGGKSYLVSRSLHDLESRLDPSSFLRVHRSAIVRLDRIAEVEPVGSSRYRLTLTGGTTLIVSRSRAGALKRLVL